MLTKTHNMSTPHGDMTRAEALAIMPVPETIKIQNVTYDVTGISWGANGIHYELRLRGKRVVYTKQWWSCRPDGTFFKRML